jgi:hypothetical protein
MVNEIIMSKANKKDKNLVTSKAGTAMENSSKNDHEGQVPDSKFSATQHNMTATDTNTATMDSTVTDNSNVSETTESMQNLQKQILMLTNLVSSLVEHQEKGKEDPSTSGFVPPSNKDNSFPRKRAAKEHDISSSEEEEEEHISDIDSDEEAQLLRPSSPKKVKKDYLERFLKRGESDKVKEHDKSVSWVKKAQSKYSKPQEKGPKVQKELADVINFLSTEEALQAKVDDVVFPENLNLITSRVNPEIYSGISERAKYMEKSFQGINQSINEGISLIAYSIHYGRCERNPSGRSKIEISRCSKHFNSGHFIFIATKT